MSTFKGYESLTKKNAGAVAAKNAEVNDVAIPEAEHSILDLSYSHKTTFNVGKLIPIGYWEALPGDTFDIDISVLLKMSIPSAPTMDNPRYDVNVFFVPWQQVWKNWNNLIGESYEGGAPVTPSTVPTLNYSTIGTELVNTYNWNGVVYNTNSLWDYFNLPINQNLENWNFNFNVLPFRAYTKIWNDWFRDENLDGIADFSNNNNPDNGTPTAEFLNSAINQGNLAGAQYGFTVLKTNRLRDYFASCLPFIQKGTQPILSAFNINDIYANTTIQIPNLSVNNGGDVSFTPNWTIQGMDNANYTNNYALFLNQDSTVVTEQNYNTNTSYGANLTLQTQQGTATPTFNGTTSSGSGLFNINDLRQALVKQHQMELDARAGTRYYEKLLAYWGIELNPLEIGRSELIGGFHNQVNINNIVQTAPATNQSPNEPVGSLKGLSITNGQSPKMHYAVEQYGIIIATITVRSNITYSQGIPKLFSKVNNWDFYNPTFNGISEQPIYTYEIFANNITTTSNGTTTTTTPDFTAIFGYNQPFADLKYKVNVASGYLGVNATDTYYTFYTYQDALSSAPTLSNEWMYYPASAIEDTLLLDANNKNENINDMLADFYFNVKCSRTIPAYSIPGVKKV